MNHLGSAAAMRDRSACPMVSHISSPPPQLRSTSTSGQHHASTSSAAQRAGDDEIPTPSSRRTHGHSRTA